MCLIAIHPGSAPFSDTEAESAYETNPHGIGCTYSDGTRLVLDLAIPTTSSAMLGFYRYHNERASAHNSDIVWHWRFRTHGPISLDNTHPFPVLPNLVVAHNGVIPGFGDVLRSDTRAYVEDRLRPLAMRAPLDLDLVARETRNSCLAFASVDRAGSLVTTTTGTWYEHNGSRVSNTYWTPRPTHGRGYVRWSDDDATGIADSIYAISISDGGDLEAECEREALTFRDPQWALRVLRDTFRLDLDLEPEEDLWSHSLRRR